MNDDPTDDPLDYTNVPLDALEQEPSHRLEVLAATQPNCDGAQPVILAPLVESVERALIACIDEEVRYRLAIAAMSAIRAVEAGHPATAVTARGIADTVMTVWKKAGPRPTDGRT